MLQIARNSILALLLAISSSLVLCWIFNHQAEPIKAAANSTINFQGKIVNKTSGTNLVTGTPACVVSGAGNDTCDFRVNIYTESSGGTLLFREPHLNVEIGEYNGIFNLLINSVCDNWSSPGGSCSGSGITWGSDPTIYIEVEFDPSGNADFSEGETFTRKLLTSVPYAYYADVAGSISGFTSSDFVRFRPSSAQTSGDTTNSLIWLNENGTGSPNFLEFEVGGSDRLVVNNSGQLGIGTSSPEDLLHLRGTTVAVSDYQLILQGADSFYGAGISFQSVLGGGGLKEGARITADGEAAWSTTTSTQDAGLRFFTTLDGTTSEVVRISSEGELGIGVTIPTSWVDIQAATTARAQLNLSTSSGVNPSSLFSGDLWWNGTALNFYNGSTTVNLLAAGGITSLNGLTAATQTFANDTNVTISSLTSTHTIGWSGQLALSRGGTGANLTDPNADRIMFWDDSLGAVTWLSPGTGLSISGTTINNTVSNLFTDGGSVTYLTSLTDDFAIGASSLVAPFSVDESLNTVRIGEGSGSNAILNMYASDGDTGSITYDTNDSWVFSGGSVYHQVLGLSVSDLGGSFTTRHTVSSGDTANMYGYTFNYQVSNSGITNTASVVPVSITGVLGNSTTFTGGHGTLSGLQVTTGLSTAGTLTNNYSIHVIPSFTAGTVTTNQGIRVNSTVGGGTVTNNYGIFIQDQTVGSSDYGLYIEGADTYALWVDNDDVRFDNDLIVGGNTSAAETIANASFTLGGDDLFVAGQIGAESDIFTDAGIVVGNSALTAGGTIEYDGTDVFAYRSDKAISLTEGFLYDKHRQDITTNNTVSDQLVRKGWGYSQGSTSGTGTVSFGITFEEVPIVSFDLAGRTNSAPSVLSDCVDHADFNIVLSGITTSNFEYSRNVGSSSIYYCYVWIAIGEYTTNYGADLAESYLTRDLELRPGEVVAIDENNDITVRKSSGVYDGKAFGIVTTAPGQVLGNEDGTSEDRATVASLQAIEKNKKLIDEGKAKVVAIALEGRVPVKVTMENGSIKKGDYLTSASKPGYAMRATKPGNIIGRALEDFNETTPGLLQYDDPEYKVIMDAVKAGETKSLNDLIKFDGNNGEGKIMVLVERGQQLGEADESLITRVESLQSRVLFLQGVSATMLAGLITIASLILYKKSKIFIKPTVNLLNNNSLKPNTKILH